MRRSRSSRPQEHWEFPLTQLCLAPLGVHWALLGSQIESVSEAEPAVLKLSGIESPAGIDPRRISWGSLPSSGPKDLARTRKDQSFPAGSAQGDAGWTRNSGVSTSKC